jgi:hypothetical protein
MFIENEELGLVPAVNYGTVAKSNIRDLQPAGGYDATYYPFTKYEIVNFYNEISGNLTVPCKNSSMILQFQRDEFLKLYAEALAVGRASYNKYGKYGNESYKGSVSKYAEDYLKKLYCETTKTKTTNFRLSDAFEVEAQVAQRNAMMKEAEGMMGLSNIWDDIVGGGKAVVQETVDKAGSEGQKIIDTNVNEPVKKVVADVTGGSVVSKAGGFLTSIFGGGGSSSTTTNPDGTTTPAKSSTGKTVLIVAGVAGAGIIAYMLLKPKKGKGKKRS